jgi:hypothetical protein
MRKHIRAVLAKIDDMVAILGDTASTMAARKELSEVKLQFAAAQRRISALDYESRAAVAKIDQVKAEFDAFFGNVSASVPGKMRKNDVAGRIDVLSAIGKTQQAGFEAESFRKIAALTSRADLIEQIALLGVKADMMHNDGLSAADAEGLTVEEDVREDDIVIATEHVRAVLLHLTSEQFIEAIWSKLLEAPLGKQKLRDAILYGFQMSGLSGAFEGRQHVARIVLLERELADEREKNRPVKEARDMFARKGDAVNKGITNICAKIFRENGVSVSDQQSARIAHQLGKEVLSIFLSIAVPDDGNHPMSRTRAVNFADTLAQILGTSLPPSISPRRVGPFSLGGVMAPPLGRSPHVFGIDLGENTPHIDDTNPEDIAREMVHGDEKDEGKDNG